MPNEVLHSLGVQTSEDLIGIIRRDAEIVEAHGQGIPPDISRALRWQIGENLSSRTVKPPIRGRVPQI